MLRHRAVRFVSSSTHVPEATSALPVSAQSYVASTSHFSCGIMRIARQPSMPFSLVWVRASISEREREREREREH